VKYFFTLVLFMAAGCGSDPEVTREYSRETVVQQAECPQVAAHLNCESIVEKLIEQGRIKRRKWEKLTPASVCSELE
jgi:uncharacterized protein YcfL